MCLAQGPQGSDAGEARTRGPSVSCRYFVTIALENPIFFREGKIEDVGEGDDIEGSEREREWG